MEILELKDNKRPQKFKKALFELVNSSGFDIIVVILLIGSIFLLFVDVVFSMDARLKEALILVEWGVTAFFALEYLARLYVANNKRNFFTSHIVDLLAIAPLFRFFRIFRVLRLLKFLNSQTLKRWAQAFNEKASFFSFSVQEKVFEVGLVFFSLFCLVSVGAVGILAFEKGHNEQFETFGDGIWWAVVTLTTVGYGDKFPITTGGRYLAIFIMLTGLGFFALITSFISSFIIERYRKGADKGMELANLSKHILVCGWNSNASAVLQELESLYHEEIKFRAVIAQEEPDLVFDKRTTFYKADFSRIEVLEKAQVEKADAVIILADKTSSRSDQDVDARTILTVLGIKKKYPQVYVCAEIVQKNNVEHILNAGVDEFINSFDYTGNLLAHAVKTKGITKIYTELLQTNVGNHFKKVRMESSFDGKSFHECAQFFSKEFHSILIGLERNNSFLINPGADFVLRGDDEAVVIAKRE